jgi:hypothetical protein
MSQKEGKQEEKLEGGNEEKVGRRFTLKLSSQLQ